MEESSHGNGKSMKFWFALLGLILVIAGIAAVVLANNWSLPDLSTAGMLLVVSGILVGVLAALNSEKEKSDH